MEQFVTNDDLLHCLGENIKSTELLCALCLTNKLFKACFTPFLYRSVATFGAYFGRGDTLTAGGDEDDTGLTGRDGAPPVPHCGVCDPNWPPDTFAFSFDIDMDRNPNVRHVKELMVGLHNGYDDWRNAELFDRLLSKMPRLEILNVNTAGDVNLLYLISVRFPRLKSLTFECSDIDPEATRRLPSFQRLIGPEPAVNFGIFTQLTSLTLTELRRSGPVSGMDVVSMLLATSQLRELALDCAINKWEDLDLRERWNPISFIPDLCDAYGQSGGTPLKLRRLELGANTQLHGTRHRWLLQAALGGMENLLTLEEVPPLHNQPTASYLEKLCDLSVLEELCVDNYPHSVDRVAYTARNRAFMRQLSGHFAWETFTKQRAPRLRRVWVTQVDNDFFDWIHDHVAFVDGYGEHMTISYGKQVQLNGALSGLMAMGWQPKELETDLEWDGRGRKMAIDHIAMHGRQLEGLTLVPFLSDTDRQCKVYGKLIAQLPRLKVFRLRRIVFDPHGENEDLYVRQSFAEPDLALLTELVRDSTSLKYIMVGAFAWSVVRNREGRAVKLLGMSASEWEDVELFRPHPWLHLFDDQKELPRKGYRCYDPVFKNFRRPRDLMLPKFGRPRRTTAKYN